MPDSDRKAGFKKMLTERPKKSALPGSINEWFSTHQEAREFVETWAELRASGETDWSPTRIHLTLKKEYGFPFSSSSNFRRWTVDAFGADFSSASEAPLDGE